MLNETLDLSGVDEDVEKVAAKAAPKKRSKHAPIIYTETEKLEHEIKLLNAKLAAALKGNTALLEEVKYINSILAEATGMKDYQVYTAIRERSLTVTHTN